MSGSAQSCAAAAHGASAELRQTMSSSRQLTINSAIAALFGSAIAVAASRARSAGLVIASGGMALTPALMSVMTKDGEPLPLPGLARRRPGWCSFRRRLTDHKPDLALPRHMLDPLPADPAGAALPDRLVPSSKRRLYMLPIDAMGLAPGHVDRALRHLSLERDHLPRRVARELSPSARAAARPGQGRPSRRRRRFEIVDVAVQRPGDVMAIENALLGRDLRQRLLGLAISSAFRRAALSSKRDPRWLKPHRRWEVKARPRCESLAAKAWLRKFGAAVTYQHMGLCDFSMETKKHDSVRSLSPREVCDPGDQHHSRLRPLEIFEERGVGEARIGIPTPLEAME